jgi:hypothetical protein
LVAEVAANTGWAWDEIEDTLTFVRLGALREQWRKHPPVHMLAAAFMGYKPPTVGQKIAEAVRSKMRAALDAVIGANKG